MVRGLKYENAKQAPFQLPAYTYYDPPVSLQRIINMYPDRLSPQDANKFVLRKFKGYEFWLGFNEGIILALHVFKGFLYVATKTALLKVASDKTFVKIGTIGGAEDIQILNTSNLLVLRIDSAIYTHTTNDVDNLVLVTDPDLQPTSDITIVNNYVFSVISGQDGQFQWSDFNDPDDFDALNFATAEYRADRLNAVVAHRNEFLLFGDTTVEFWAVVGGSNVVAPRNYASNIGCITKDSIQSIKDDLFFIGIDGKDGQVGVYLLRGYQPSNIASKAIITILSGIDLNAAYAFTHFEGGYDFYTIVVPDVCSFSYLPALDSWVERKSWDSLSGAFKNDTNIKNSISFNNKTLVQAQNQSALFMLGGDQEADDIFPWELIFPSTTVKPYKRCVSSFNVEVLYASGLIGMSLSQDDGRTWLADDWRDVDDLGMGARVLTWHRLGWIERGAFRLKGYNETTLLGGWLGL